MSAQYTPSTRDPEVQRRQESYVVDTSRSRYARLRPVPITAVQLADDFWAPRRLINQTATLPAQYRYLEETGRLDNFRRAAGTRPDLPFQGIYFNDSDVYKWLEAASWALAAGDDPGLAQMVDAAISEVAAAQRPDGYLNTYFACERAAERWTNFDLHEMYCAGHLFQAAVAHYRATGSTRLLDVATRFADHICATFGPAAQGKREAVDGHEEIELALVELYRATGERRYLDHAQYFIDARGHGLLGNPYDRFSPAYSQDDRPLRELETIDGHAVRAVYYMSGATDLYAETGDPMLKTALDRLWRNMTTRRMYVSGGIGARYEGEAFGADYELPNARAYTETCAAIGSVMWNWRMLALDGDARYADLLEHTLYNAVLPGLSLDGEHYFYQNPLADEGAHRREPWFGCACCPPNVARLLAQLPGYFFSVADDGIWAHLYAQGSAEIALSDGRTIRLTIETRYPWDGDVTIEVDGTGEFSLFLRIPGWCEAGATLEVAGEPWSGDLTSGSYVELRRVWQPGATIRLRLPMPARRVVAHPYVAENTDHVALIRGPILYAVEGVDHPNLDLRDLVLPATSQLSDTFQADLLGGVVTIRGEAQAVDLAATWDDALYRSAEAVPVDQAARRAPLTATPYFAWANRAPGQMRVWIREA